MIFESLRKDVFWKKFKRTRKQVYVPLDPLKKEIRVLVVAPSLDERGRVNARLETISLLSSNVCYECISWVWGDTSDRRPLVLNGTVVSVPLSAAVVLQSLSVEQGHSRVWLDAVCIDMANGSERNHQVAMMKIVYSRAQRTLAWLGESYPGAGDAIQEVQRVAEQCRQLIGASAERYHELKRTLRGPHAARKGLDSYRNLDIVYQFYGSPWFRRLWPIQEWYLSKEAICFYGPHAVAHADVFLAAGWICRQGTPQYRTGAIGEGSIGLSHSAKLYEDLMNPESTSARLDDLLTLFTRFLVTECRDGVYGTYGIIEALVKGYPNASMHPDYEKPEYEVYAAVTRAAIESAPSGPLRILRISQCTARNPDPSWPSWVIKKSGQRKGAAVAFNFADNYKADGNESMVYLNDPRRPQTLIIQGLKVAAITACTPVLKDNAKGSIIIETLLEWRRFAQQHRSRMKMPEEETEVQFALSITGGVTYYQRDATNSDYWMQCYKSFLAKSETWKATQPRAVLDPRVSKLSYILTKGDAYWFAYCMRGRSGGRRLFVTVDGSLGIGPRYMQKGDVVCILFGHWAPFVLRSHGEDWRLIGQAYLSGVMRGEYVEALREKGTLDGKRHMFNID